MKNVGLLGSDEPSTAEEIAAIAEEIAAIQKQLSETCNDPNLVIITSSPTYEQFMADYAVSFDIPYRGIWEETSRISSMTEPLLLTQ